MYFTVKNCNESPGFEKFHNHHYNNIRNAAYMFWDCSAIYFTIAVNNRSNMILHSEISGFEDHKCKATATL